MKFVFRQKEVNEIARLRWLAEEQHTRVALVSGPVGIGKKSIVREALKGREVRWIDAEMGTENLLVRNLKTDGHNLVECFKRLFREAEDKDLNVVVENAGRLESSVPDFYEELEHLLRERKRRTSLFLCLITSSEKTDFGLTNVIDSHVKAGPLPLQEIRELLLKSNPNATGEDTLSLYAATGGVPQYIGWLLDAGANTAERIVAASEDPASPVSHIGKNLLSRTLGTLTPVYTSILSLLAEGYASAPQIQERMGINVGGHLARLEEDYGLVRKLRPPFAKEGLRNIVRYEIKPLELLWWFQHAGGVGINEQNRLLALRRYFRDKMKQKEGYAVAEGWWHPATGEEFDLVAYTPGRKTVVVGDLCENLDAFDMETFKKKLQHFRIASGKSSAIDARLFTKEDL